MKEARKMFKLDLMILLQLVGVPLFYNVVERCAVPHADIPVVGKQ